MRETGLFNHIPSKSTVKKYEYSSVLTKFQLGRNV
jgi:hypothetical protein